MIEKGGEAVLGTSAISLTSVSRIANWILFFENIYLFLSNALDILVTMRSRNGPIKINWLIDSCHDV